MRHLCHHKQISRGPPPADFNCQALGIAPGSVSQAVQFHPRLGRAGSRAAGARLKPLPLEFPNRVDQPPWVLPGLSGEIILSTAAAAAPDMLITICFSTSPPAREVLGRERSGDTGGSSG